MLILLAQSVHQIDELKHVVVGGEIDEDGLDTHRSLNYNVAYSYVVKAIQERNGIDKATTATTDRCTQTTDRLIEHNIIKRLILMLSANMLNSKRQDK